MDIEIEPVEIGRDQTSSPDGYELVAHARILFHAPVGARKGLCRPDALAEGSLLNISFHAE